jgi:hypothetical protein
MFSTYGFALGTFQEFIRQLNIKSVVVLQPLGLMDELDGKIDKLRQVFRAAQRHDVLLAQNRAAPTIMRCVRWSVLVITQSPSRMRSLGLSSIFTATPNSSLRHPIVADAG